MRPATAIEILLERKTKLQKEAVDQKLFMTEIGPFLTSSEEQQLDARRYNEVLRKLRLVNEEISELARTRSD
jgi:hypothetical protein